MSLCLLSLALAVMLLTPDAQAAGVTWYVDDDYVECPDANFSTIQQAINNASDYDVIIVCDGTYSESININKSLVIRSQNGPGVTLIDGGEADRAVSVNASGVTFGGDGQGFYLGDAGVGIAMYTGSHGVGDVNMSGISIVGNVVQDCGAGILIANVGDNTDIYGITLLNNTVYNCDEVGIRFGGDGDGDVYDNTVAHNVVNDSWYCIDFYLESFGNGSISDNTVFNNTVHHCIWGIDLWEEGFGGGGDISGNTVEGNTVHDCYDAGVSLISWGVPTVVNNTVVNNTVYGCYDGEPSEIEDFSAGIFLFSGFGNVSGNTIEGNEVYDSWNGIYGWSLGCGNLSGNTIAGNTVNHTIWGITLNASMCLGGDPFAGAGSATVAVEASGDDGRHRLPSTGGMGFPSVSRDDGIDEWSANGEEGIVGEEFGQPPFLPFDLGVYDNTIAGNEVYDYGVFGIGLLAFKGLSYGNTVEGNTVYNAGDEFEWTSGIALATMYGLLFNTTVADNTVYEGLWGIGLFNLGPSIIAYSTIEGNRVWCHDICIELNNSMGMIVTDIDVRDNVLYNRSLAEESGEPQSWEGIGMLGCGNISVHNNSIAYSGETGLNITDSWNVSVTSNRIFNNSEGIYIRELIEEIDLPDCNIRIIRNDILNNGGGGSTGIYIDDGEPSDAGEIRINCNNIVGNSGYGIYNDDETPFWADCNWWGDPSGPFGTGPFPTTYNGSGDNVSYMYSWPWLDVPVSLNTSARVLNATAVPSMVSIYDWEHLFGDMEQEIYTLGPSYTDIIVEVDCCNQAGVLVCAAICGYWNATVNLSDLLLQVLPAGFVEDYVAEWSEEGQDIWGEWLDNLSAVEMDFEYHSNGETLCLVDYELWLEGLFLWNESYSEGGIALEEYFDVEYDPDGYEELLDLIFEELRLGQVQVPVELQPYGGVPVTVYVPLTVVDFQLPLDEGWNLRSAPLKLDSNWDTIGDVYVMGDGLNGLEAFITWDSESGMWVEPGPMAALKPWYAYYIKMAERDQMGLIVDRAGPPPLTDKRQLHAGWNLVGVVPDFRDINESLPEAHPFPAMDPWEALSSVGGNWSQAVGMEEFLNYTENFSYRWIELEEKDPYDKYFWQEIFTAYPNGSHLAWGPPFVSPGGGFWVYMDNAAMLEAIRYTPLPWGLCLEEPEP